MMKKKFSILIIIILFSIATKAQDTYPSFWKKVQKLEMNHTPKSALKVVETIYQKAIKESNSPQLIKTLFYKSKYALILEENASLKIIYQFKNHISKSKFPTKNVLENILANLYWQYFQQNRWKFYNRTYTKEKVNVTDFRTWDLHTLFTEIHTYFKASLKNKLLLQQVSIYDFAEILQVQKNAKNYKPTLFDFLAHNALQFYKTPEHNIAKPTYHFTINNPNLLKAAKNFIALNLTTKDTLSLQFNALKIYQDLIVAHSNDKNVSALAMVNLERLQFVTQHATFPNKKLLFFQTLKAAQKKYKRNEVSGLYAYEIAKIYHQQANSYTPTNTSKHRFKNKEAIATCNFIINQFPESLGAKNCSQLKTQIQQRSLSITSEKFVPINTNSRLLINYKNINRLNFTAYKINQKQLKSFYRIYKNDAKIKFIQKLKKVANWNTKLRNEYDYLQHTTEVIVPKLNQGSYLIVATENKELNSKKLYGVTAIQSTNIALVTNNFNGKYKYQIVDRNTGKPIKNAVVNLKNYPIGRYHKSINRNLITDKNGFASFTSYNRYSNVVITVTDKKDKAFFGNYYLYRQRKYYSNSKKTKKTFLFTDRSIYRPGQIVYFKGISIETYKEKSTIISNKNVVAILKDVNGQVVKKLDLQTNDFGSFSGRFITPNSGLTGNYTIETNIGSYKNYTTISVEEYKRPKFETQFTPITKTYKLNDSVVVNGIAKSFSGTNITGAKVVYRVRRKVQYPNWFYWRTSNFSSETQEINYGKSITNSSGNFSVKFKAIPDKSVSNKNFPIFIYQITADVTDINGETRSATTTVKVGNHSLLATLSIANAIAKNTKEEIIKINTQNLNGEFIPAKGTVKIYKLQAPKNPVRKRIWTAPDYQDIAENEFRKLFPNEAYTNKESNKNNWEKGKLVFTTHFDTKKSKEIKLSNFKKWISGKYIAVLNTKDRYNQKVKEQQYFNVFSNQDKKVADNQLFVIRANKKNYKPNEKVILQIGSASKNNTVVVQVEKNKTITNTYLVHLHNQMKTLKIPVTKNDIGGFAITYHFVNFNSFESGNLLIDVPQEQNNIEIETNIFRDKLQPGQNETWSFTVKNDTKDKIAAEMLASMYDASLDQFKSHYWQFNPFIKKRYYSYNRSAANESFSANYFQINNNNNNNKYYHSPIIQPLDTYNWFGFSFNAKKTFLSNLKREVLNVMMDNKILEKTVIEYTESDESESDFYAMDTNNNSIKKHKKTSLKDVVIRKNLEETAFFFPQLKTDKNGQISFNFTTPEALTKWKLQLLAHTKELQSVTKTLTAVTQKELMVFPNAPRFLREGDTIVFSAKISNLTNNQLNGFAQLELTDAITGKDITKKLLDTSTTLHYQNKKFTVDADGNTNVSWNLTIPKTIQAVQYKIVATSGYFSDGEQNVLPVLSNKVLVTETLPIWVRSNQTKVFTLNKLKNENSPTLSHHKLTLEMTSNPAWYAVQALPYLMEYPEECSEQTFSRYYANTLASFIVNANSRIKEVFNSWKSSDALVSNLEKNQELKSLIIQETPWLRDAQSETEQKKRIALLFDLHTIKNQQEKTITKLKDMQFSNGGFPWFKGGYYPNRFITNYIAIGFGHLRKLGVTQLDNTAKKMLTKAVLFLDDEIVNQYQKLLKIANKIKAEKGIKKYKDYVKQNHLTYFTLQYLYMRSFYGDISLSKETKKAVNYYKKQSVKYWSNFNLYGKGQIALIQFRNGDKTISNKILKSLKENSITSNELGMYWKENTSSWYWYQSPIETQSLLIETFSEIENDTKTVDNLKIWLLKNKQVNRWKTTKATTEAVYALLLNGSDWSETNTDRNKSITNMVDVKLGNQEIEPTKLENVKLEAGTGYFKTSWNGSEINKEMSKITISKKENGIAWGGLYWQYFEDLDKVTSAKTPLQLNKKLFKKINSDIGKKLIKINNKTILKIGDLLTVRIELKVDRNMEFIHMKDMRASSLEPVKVLSQYKWQDGLSYYQSIKDASTSFFFDRLTKGIYIFEYDVRVGSSGNFSNGITTIESMYAPEFKSHSKGVRIIVK